MKPTLGDVMKQTRNFIVRLATSVIFLCSCNKNVQQMACFCKITEQEIMINASRAIDSLETLKILIPKYGTEVRDVHGRTLLHIASEAGNINAVKYLLKNKAKVNVQSNEGRTPLYSAISTGQTEVCQILIKEGADPNIKTNSKGFSSLHRASCDGKANLTLMLLKLKITDQSLKNADGESFLDVARRMKRDNVLKIAGEKLDTIPKKPVSIPSTISASSSSTISVASTAASLAPTVPAQRRSPSPSRNLDNSNCGLALEITQKEIDNLIDMGQTGFEVSGKNNLLHCIAAIGNAQQALEVIKAGINTNERNSRSETPLHIALKMNNNSVAETLIKEGADIDADITYGGNTPLIIATLVGNADGVRMLLDAGADIDSETEDGASFGRTGILCAAHRNYDEIVEIYLAKNASRMTSRDFILRNVLKVTEAISQIANSAAVEFIGAPDLSEYIKCVPDLNSKKEDLYKKIIRIYNHSSWIMNHKGTIKTTDDLKAYHKAIDHLEKSVNKYKSKIKDIQNNLEKQEKKSLTIQRTQALKELEVQADVTIKVFINDMKKSIDIVKQFFSANIKSIQNKKSKPDTDVFDQLIQLYKNAQMAKDKVNSRLEHLERQVRAIGR